MSAPRPVQAEPMPCDFGRERCEEPAAYELRYVWTERSDRPAYACVKHTALVRAFDPLDYIESVRTLRSNEAGAEVVAVGGVGHE